MAAILKRMTVSFWNFVTIYSLVRCALHGEFYDDIFLWFWVMSFYWQNTYIQPDGKLYILSHTFIGIFLLFRCSRPFSRIVHREQTPCIIVVNNCATSVTQLSRASLRACVARNTLQESRPNRNLLSIPLPIILYCISLTVCTSNWFMGTGRRRKVRLGKWQNVLRITQFCQQKSGKAEQIS